MVRYKKKENFFDITVLTCICIVYSKYIAVYKAKETYIRWWLYVFVDVHRPRHRAMVTKEVQGVTIVLLELGSARLGASWRGATRTSVWDFITNDLIICFPFGGE